MLKTLLGAERPNIVVVVADSLPWMNCSKNSRLTGLPNASARGVEFTRANAAGCWTASATASFFTGKAPYEHGLDAQTRKLNSDIPALADILKSQGYKTHQVTANVVTGIFGLDRGFEQVNRIWKSAPRRGNDSPLLHSALETVGLGTVSEVMQQSPAGANPLLNFLLSLAAKKRIRENLPIGKLLAKPNKAMADISEDLEAGIVWFHSQADRQIEAARAILQDQSPDPKFVFVNFMETHFPYHMGPHFGLATEGGILNSPAKGRELLGLYNFINQEFMIQEQDPISLQTGEVLRQRQIRSWEVLAPKIDAFFSELHEMGIGLAVFLADHGDNFGTEDGWWYHFANVTSQGTRVPLLIQGAGITARVEDQPVSTRHLFDTILKAAGVEKAYNPELDLLSGNNFPYPDLSAAWYDNRGVTRPEYKRNQFAFIYEGMIRFVYRQGRWFAAPFADDAGVYAFQPVSGNPLEDLPMSFENRYRLRKSFEKYRAFSNRIGEGD